MARQRKSKPRDVELAALGWAIEKLLHRSPELTQAKVADNANLSGNLVSRYVCGQVAPTFHNLLLLCEGLGAKPVELIALVEEFKARAQRAEEAERPERARDLAGVACGLAGGDLAGIDSGA